MGVPIVSCSKQTGLRAAGASAEGRSSTFHRAAQSTIDTPPSSYTVVHSFHSSQMLVRPHSVVAWVYSVHFQELLYIVGGARMPCRIHHDTSNNREQHRQQPNQYTESVELWLGTFQAYTCTWVAYSFRCDQVIIHKGFFQVSITDVWCIS